LPRESASKEVDSACLSVIGYPAWAVEDPQLAERTRKKIRAELGGACGYKRFRRDGHQTVVEDHTRLHYEREELAAFEHIECEWPLFLAYELITACCEERWEEARQWRQRLSELSVAVNGVELLPELYLVPAAAIPAERRNPSRVVDQSRRRRIAAGAGVEPHEVGDLVKQFDGMSAMMKGMAGLGMRDRLREVQRLQTQLSNPAARLGRPKGDTGKRLTADERRKQKKQREKEARRKKRG
jgi:hypothetical protein